MSYIGDVRKKILCQQYEANTSNAMIRQLIEAAPPYTPVDDKTVRGWVRGLHLVRGAKHLTDERRAVIQDMVDDPAQYWSWGDIAARLSTPETKISVTMVRQWGRKMQLPPRDRPPGTLPRGFVPPSNEKPLAPVSTEWEVVRNWAMRNGIDARRIPPIQVMAAVNRKRAQHGLPHFMLRAPAHDLRLVK